MGLIIKDKIKMFMVGYPTVSDKYNVAGGILEGTLPAKFGELVKLGSTAGYFKAIDGTTVTLSAVTDIGGFALATNVKLNETWPAGTVQINPGEAFNLLVDGFIAVELDAEATMANVNANAPCYVILATGKITTSDKASAGTVVQLPNCYFTGMKELQGTAKVAEVYVK